MNSMSAPMTHDTSRRWQMLVITLVIYCFATLTEKSIVTPELLERMEPFFENEDLEGLAAYVAERPQATARIVDRMKGLGVDLSPWGL